MTKAPFTGNCERSKDLLDLIHIDVCSPFRSPTRHSERYFVTFTDYFSRYGYVYLIKHKSETFRCLGYTNTKFRINWVNRLRFSDLIEVESILVRNFATILEIVGLSHN